MSDDRQDVLDYLRAQFARVHQRFDRVEQLLDEHTVRLGMLERGQVDLRRDNAEVHAALAAINQRLDNQSRQVERINRRLELTETA
jgi:hypothetical protein